jgi:hypothetical protein
LSRVDSTAYLLAEGADAGHCLGAAILWAEKHNASSLVLLADEEHAGDLARRAAYFVRHEITVYKVIGTGLKPVTSRPLPPIPKLGDDIWALAGLINETGARGVDDHGRLVAEVAGLEVARVTVDDDGTLHVDVGVGQADRELHQLVHGSLATDAALRRAVAMVAVHRHAGANFHPLNNMARERWLRSVLLDRPELVGARSLDPVPPLEPRTTLLGQQPIAAVGEDVAGSPLVVVCSTGVDPEFVPDAADYRARFDVDAHLILVVPPRDRYPITERLTAELHGAELTSIAAPWDPLVDRQSP